MKAGLKVSSIAGKMIMSARKATRTGGTLSFPPFFNGPKLDSMKMEKPRERVIVVYNKARPQVLMVAERAWW